MPATVIPWAVDEMKGSAGRLPCYASVCVQGTVTVVRIERPSYYQYGRKIAPEMAARATFLPERIIIRMFHHTVPESKRVRKCSGYAFHSTGIQKKGIHVALDSGRRLRSLRSGIVMFSVHRTAERVCIKEHQYPVMMSIIPHVPVIYRSLRRYGLNGRMA